MLCTYHRLLGREQFGMLYIHHAGAQGRNSIWYVHHAGSQGRNSLLHAIPVLCILLQAHKGMSLVEGTPLGSFHAATGSRRPRAASQVLYILLQTHEGCTMPVRYYILHANT